MYPLFCGWCEKKIGMSAVKNSTGICKECLERMLKENENEEVQKV